jgi:hypothetical protein
MDSLYSHLRPSLSLFDGFPYLNTRVVPALYHIILLPARASETSLADTAGRQVLANRLSMCLVLGPDRAIYYEPDGRSVVSDEPPRGGNLTAGQLAPAIDVNDQSEEFRVRQNRLADVVDRRRRAGGFMLGDLSKGGRAATDEEKQRLNGESPDGAPRGLTRCGTCGDWTGVCLDPSEKFAGRVMVVHCYCDNHNDCARCYRPLYERRLNANYYDPRDRGIWHVPGFCGLDHRCPAGDHSGVRAS